MSAEPCAKTLGNPRECDAVWSGDQLCGACSGLAWPSLLPCTLGLSPHETRLAAEPNPQKYCRCSVLTRLSLAASTQARVSSRNTRASERAADICRTSLEGYDAMWSGDWLFGSLLPCTLGLSPHMSASHASATTSRFATFASHAHHQRIGGAPDTDPDQSMRKWHSTPCGTGEGTHLPNMNKA